MEQPRGHRARRRLAVRARDCQHMPAVKDVVGEPLRSGYIRVASIQDRLYQGVSACDHVANYPHVRRYRKLVSVVTLDHAYVRRGELVAHWRVHIYVATAHDVTGSLRKLRETAHKGSRNAENVKVQRSGCKR
jgi:hypothetical protein